MMGLYRSVVSDPLEALSLPVQVALPEADAKARRLYGHPVPAPVAVHLILDTGSRLSSLTPEILGQVQAPTCGRTRVQGSVGEGPATLDKVRMEFLRSSLAPLPAMVVVGL